MVARTCRTCVRLSSVRALADRRSVTVAVLPPATLNEPLAMVRTLALGFLDPAVLAMTALSVRSVTVPVQRLSVAGQVTFMLTVPEEVAVKDVLANLASGTGGVA